MYIGLISLSPRRKGINNNKGFHWLGAFKGTSPSTSAVMPPSILHCLTVNPVLYIHLIMIKAKLTFNVKNHNPCI